MSHFERNMDVLNRRRIVYIRPPISDIPTEVYDWGNYYDYGTYQHYALFKSKAKINTYKSLKWHLLVLWYLNPQLDQDDFETLAKDICTRENGFVTFFMKQKILNNMINEVLGIGDTPPRNRIRKVIFKHGTGLTLSQKLSIVGKLIGKGKKVSEDDIYQCMLDLNHEKQKITISKLAKLLSCTTRTIHRNMGNQLKTEKELLNNEL